MRRWAEPAGQPVQRAFGVAVHETCTCLQNLQQYFSGGTDGSKVVLARSDAGRSVQKVITDMKARLKDPDLARLFENTFPNTLGNAVL